MATIEKEVKETKNQNVCSYGDDPANKDCDHLALPGHKHCVLHSPDKNKDKELFNEAFNQELENQKDSDEPDILDIEGFVFPVEFDFYDTGFKGLHARGATFLEDALFFNAKFNYTDFVGTTFEKTAYFDIATFNDKADFSHATFKEEALFYETKFMKGADFISSTFKKNAYFEDSKLNDTLFKNTHFGPGTSFKSADLTKVEFRSMSVSCCEFIDSVGLEVCCFRHVRWNNPNIVPAFKDLIKKDYEFNLIKWISAKRNKRWILADEIEQLRPDKYQELLSASENNDLKEKHNDKQSKSNKLDNDKLYAIETAYRELKVNYENHKNFPDAGHFHIGEMEMKRLRKGWKRFLSLSNVYWAFSGYGERWRRALISFLIIFTACALIYNWQGKYSSQSFSQTNEVSQPIEINIPLTDMDTKSNKPMIVNRKIKFDIEPLKEKTIKPNLSDSFLLSAKVSFLRTDSFSQATTTLTNWVMIFEIIFAPITLGLMGLAIFRKFKRN